MGIVLGFLCFILAYALRGLNDELRHHFNSIKIPFIRNNTKFWDPRRSWVNKYKATKVEGTGHKLEPKFPGSTTILVWTTDGFHLVRFLENICIAWGIVFFICNFSTWMLLAYLAIHAGLTTVQSITMRKV